MTLPDVLVTPLGTLLLKAAWAVVRGISKFLFSRSPEQCAQDQLEEDCARMEEIVRPYRNHPAQLLVQPRARNDLRVFHRLAAAGIVKPCGVRTFAVPRW